MRLIDADWLLDVVENIIDWDTERDRNRIIHQVRELTPTVDAEPHWIPVTERLPKEDGSYLVSGKWGSGKESVGDCDFSVEDGYFQTVWNFDVLAWMPLPEPYKGVTE